MKKESLKKQLIALGAETLAELLMSEAQGNATLRKQLELALIKKDPKRLATKLKQQINAIKRAKRFIEWRQAKAFMSELYTLTTAIEQDLLVQDAQTAVELIEEILMLDNNLCARIDDSDGALGDFFHALIALWGKAWQQMESKDQTLLIEKILYHLCHNNYAVKQDLIPAMKKPLGVAGLKALKAQVKKEQRLQKYERTTTLEAIADVLGDVDQYIKTVTKEAV